MSLLSAPSAAVADDSPWYEEKKPITIGRPVARRISFSAVSIASVPFSARSTRVMPGGAISSSRPESSSSSGHGMEWLSSLPYRRIVSTTGSIRSPRAAPTGTEAEAEIRSTYTLPSTSSTV